MKRLLLATFPFFLSFFLSNLVGGDYIYPFDLSMLGGEERIRLLKLACGDWWAAYKARGLYVQMVREHLNDVNFFVPSELKGESELTMTRIFTACRLIRGLLIDT